MIEDLKAAPLGSIDILHACTHNPIWCDPTKDQWKQLREFCHEQDLIVFFDSAYQRFILGILRGNYCLRRMLELLMFETKPDNSYDKSVMKKELEIIKWCYDNYSYQLKDKSIEGDLL